MFLGYHRPFAYIVGYCEGTRGEHVSAAFRQLFGASLRPVLDNIQILWPVSHFSRYQSLWTENTVCAVPSVGWSLEHFGVV